MIREDLERILITPTVRL